MNPFCQGAHGGTNCQMHLREANIPCTLELLQMSSCNVAPATKLVPLSEMSFLGQDLRAAKQQNNLINVAVDMSEAATRWTALVLVQVKRQI